MRPLMSVYAMWTVWDAQLYPQTTVLYVMIPSPHFSQRPVRPMQPPNRVIQLAKERALFRFKALAQPMVQDADASLSHALLTDKTTDPQAMTSARQFLRLDTTYFLKRFEEIYREYVERAMGTMYSNVRAKLHAISADDLSLIDDEVMVRQIEVDRLLLRMREGDNENLSRINMMIAQLHGDQDVRERENPFRPYLIARALHEVLREMVHNEGTAKVLFEHLSHALANHLSAYYATIRDVFASSGVQARLQARPGRLVEHQRYIGGSAALSDELEPLNSRILPGVQRMLELVQQVPLQASAAPRDSGTGEFTGADAGGGAAGRSAGGAGGGSDGGTAASSGGDGGATSPPSPNLSRLSELQDFLYKIFDQSRQFGQSGDAGDTGQPGQPGQSGLTAGASRAAHQGNQAGGNPPPPGADSGAPRSSASMEMFSKLNKFQQLAALGQTVDEQLHPDQNQLFSIADQIEDSKTSPTERMTIDVVAMLFDFILADEQIPASMRAQIGRLQIPFLKAAMLEPEMLQQPDHPARQLLNRMSSAAVGLDSETPVGQSVAEDMGRIVKKVLNNFEDNTSAFATGLEELETSLAQKLRHSDPETARSCDAIEEAEVLGNQVAQTSQALVRLLAPVPLDQRVFDFLTQTWARVVCRESAMKEPADGAPRAAKPFRRILPEVVWSFQEKQSPEERSILMKMLPQLVKFLKSGLLSIKLSEEECHVVLDPLIALHMEVLRVTRSSSRKLLTLEELRQYFADFIAERGPAAPLAESASAAAEFSERVPNDVIESTLADQGVAPDLSLGGNSVLAFSSDTDWLAQMKLGVSVECWADSDDNFQPARLTWISKRHTLFMFTLEQNSKPVVYSSLSLIKALREGSLRLVEYAPAFERAVEAMLLDAQAIQQSHGQGR